MRSEPDPIFRPKLSFNPGDPRQTTLDLTGGDYRIRWFKPPVAFEEALLNAVGLSARLMLRRAVNGARDRADFDERLEAGLQQLRTDYPTEFAPFCERYYVALAEAAE
jgi:hypothetical protein